MKKLFLLSICVLVSTSSAFAQKAVTITAVSNGGPVTNSITIPAGQAARIVTMSPLQFNSQTQTAASPLAGAAHFVVKDGALFGDLHRDDVFEGPVTFVIHGSTGVGNGLLTIERWRTTKLIPVR